MFAASSLYGLISFLLVGDYVLAVTSFIVSLVFSFICFRSGKQIKIQIEKFDA